MLVKTLRILSIVVCLSFIGCNSKTSTLDAVEVRIDTWYKLDRSVDKYQNLNRDRPILVLYTCDWDLVGHVVLKHLSTTKAFDLFTHHKVLPLYADVTDYDGVAAMELEKNNPYATVHCFSLTFPSQETKWFVIEDPAEEYIYNLVKDELDSYQDQIQ